MSAVCSSQFGKNSIFKIKIYIPIWILLRTWFIIITAFKNVLFNRNTGLFQTFKKHQLATIEETSQEGCTPSVKQLISANKDCLPNHILCLKDNKISPSLTHTFPESSLYTSRTRWYKLICSQTNPSLEFFQRWLTPI